MRNKLIFEGKREMIPVTVNKTIIEQRKWLEALEDLEDKQENIKEHVSTMAKSEQEIVHAENSWCYFVDSSWILSDQKADIRWLLMDEKGVKVM